MTSSRQIERFRHFNRFYTDYLGLLDTSLYGFPVNLTEARILYELDRRPGSLAREITHRLTLDKGYLSRILKRFARQGWTDETPAENDGRAKEIRLTASGAQLMQELHAGARDQAREGLSRLSPEDRKRLLDAMSTIEKILV